MLDRAVQQYLRRSFAAIERAANLLVVHPQSEAHDQRFAAIVRQFLDGVENPPQLVASFDQLLGCVNRPRLGNRVDVRLRLARAVAVKVGSEVVGDANQPRAQRPAVRFL